MSGKVGDLSPKQELILNEFKEAVSDVMRPDFDDYFLLRWLRARKFDKTKAEQMLRKSLEEKKLNGIDTILTDYTVHKLLKEYNIKVYFGLDKEGCPVHYYHVSAVDMIGLIKSVPYLDIMKQFAHQIEGDLVRMKEAEKKGNKRVETHSYIMEMEDLSIIKMLKKPVLTTLYKLIMDYESNYPEILKRAYFVNVSQAAIIFYKFLKPLLPEEIYAKISLHTPEETKAALLKDMDPDILPKCLGGTRVDPDGNPRCPKTLIPIARKVPEEYYMENSRQHFMQSPNVIKVTVPNRGSYPVEISVNRSGLILQWEFQPFEKDIGFSLLFKGQSGEGSLEEVIETKRYDCLEGTETGNHICQKPGTYILNFDNSYSWLRQVTLYYTANLFNPDSLCKEAIEE